MAKKKRKKGPAARPRASAAGPVESAAGAAASETCERNFRRSVC